MAQQFNATNAMNFAVQLCQLGPRYGGNNAEQQAANLTAKQFKNDGLNVEQDKVDLGNGQYTYNVIGKINGTNPNRYIIVGAHIDSPSDSQGALDDAAGVGILTEIGRVLGDSVKPNETIILVGFGAEELWYNGSDAFVAQHADIVANTTAMIDLNAVGGGATVAPISETILPSSANADPNLVNIILQSANVMGSPAGVGGDSYPSDAYPFFNKNVSAVEVESQPYSVSPMSSDDTYNYLELNSIQDMGQTITYALLNLTNAQQMQIKNK